MKLGRWLLMAVLLFGTALAQGTVRIGWAGSPDSLVPGKGILAEAYNIYELVYDTMFDLQFDGSFKPELAESWEISDDGLTWTFKIRSGVIWHDGEPLTANDIAYTFNLYKSDENFAYLQSNMNYFESITASDEQTLEIKLTELIPNVESKMVVAYVLPEHIFKDASEEFENTEMIGTGPFKMAEYKQGEFVWLEKNPNYWTDLPKVDEVIFQTYGSQDVLVQAIKTGELDMITRMPPTAVLSLRNDPNVQVVTGPPLSPYATDIIMNQMNPERCPTDDGGVCTGHPALLDKNVRQAMAHATDKQQLIDVLMLGLATPGFTLAPDSFVPWFNPNLTDYALDLEAANKLLDDAGYKDSDGDGVREMPDSTKPLSFRLNWPSSSTNGPRMAEMLGEMWGQIGIAVQPQAMDSDALTAICCPAFDYDIMLWGWYFDTDPSYMLGIMTDGEIVTGINETGYSSPAYDELYKKQNTTLDLEERKQIVWQMQELALNDLVYIIPYYEQAVQAYRKDRFTGWVVDEGKVELENPASLTVIESVQ